MTFSKQTIHKILDRLKEEYPHAGCELLHEDVYQLLVKVTLSAQTTDKSVNSVSEKLFSEYPDAKAMAKADPQKLEAILRSVGMYKTKTKNIIAQARMLTEKYNGIVPEDYESLVALPGVGRKTANVVLSVGFGHQRIAVDTHVFRVANRIGLAEEKDVLQTEMALMKVLPKDRWSESHHSLIFHGRRCCFARKPRCCDCVIKDMCRKAGL